MITIIMAADSNYVQHLAAAISSVVTNCMNDQPITFYIITTNVDQADKDKLAEIIDLEDLKCQPNKIIFKDIDENKISSFNEKGYLSKAMFLRLFIPEMVPDDINKVIYLDSDLIVRKDVSELWNTDVDDYLLAAVKDIGQNSYYEKFNIPRNYDIFNSGVMLINLEKWRNEKTAEKAIEYIIKNDVVDQKALNALFYDRWLSLDVKWNVYRPLLREYYKFLYDKKLLTKDIIKAASDPAIIHFTGPIKPWHFGYAYPFGKDYWKYLSKTPWKSNCRSKFTWNGLANLIKYSPKVFAIDKIRENLE